MYRTAWLSLLLSICTVRCIEQQFFSASSDSSPILGPTIDAFVKDVLSSWNSPAGISVAVVKRRDDGSWITETKGYGVGQADGSPVTENTLFGIGSNSKLFCAIAAGLLISNESLTPQISWNTKIGSIIPEWQLMDPVASEYATIIDIMSHRTGLPRHDVMYGVDESTVDIIKRLRYLKPSAEFRETYQYNNNMYTTLSYLPRALLGLPFEQYVKKNIFDRLGMNSTTYSYDVAKKSGNLANGFGREGVNKSRDVFEMGTPQPMEFWNQAGGEQGSFISGAGGVVMNAKDAATWLKTLLLSGSHPETYETIIPADVLAQVSFGRTVAVGTAGAPELSPQVYGAGQIQFSYRGHPLIEHGGATPGFLSQITRLPFDDFGIAVFSNDDSFGTFLTEIIKYRVIDEYFGLPPIDWNYRAKLLEQLHNEIGRSQITPRPKRPKRPFTSFKSLAGVYHNPGYGEFEFCFVSLPHSDSCRKLLSEARTTLPGIINHNIPTYIAKVSKLFVSHVILEHFNGNVFNVSGVDSRPTINSTKPFWALRVTEYAPLVAEFGFTEVSAERGASMGNATKVLSVGFTGGIWGAGAGLESPKGDTLEERSEVWLEKVA